MSENQEDSQFICACYLVSTNQSIDLLRDQHGRLVMLNVQRGMLTHRIEY